MDMPVEGLVLRKAGHQDADALRDFVRNAFSKWIDVIGREPMPMGADYTAAIANHHVEIGLIDMQIVCMFELHLHRAHALLETLAVAPKLQGRGLGRFLVARAESIARAHGLGEMRLLTNQKMDSNRALYARLGYVEYEFITRDDGLPGGVFMRKRLD